MLRRRTWPDLTASHFGLRLQTVPWLERLHKQPNFSQTPLRLSSKRLQRGLTKGLWDWPLKIIFYLLDSSDAAAPVGDFRVVIPWGRHGWNRNGGYFGLSLGLHFKFAGLFVCLFVFALTIVYNQSSITETFQFKDAAFNIFWWWRKKLCFKSHDFCLDFVICCDTVERNIKIGIVHDHHHFFNVAKCEKGIYLY